MGAIKEKNSGIPELKINHSKQQVIKIALAGNPNSGKTTVFNILTGLNQKIGNFPDVTIDKKTGKCILPNGREVEIIDLPGTYSLHPKSLDEIVTQEVICDPANNSYPDITVIVIDASNLKRNLFLATQVIDLKRPCLLVLNMMDLADQQKATIDVLLLSKRLGVGVIPMNARENKGLNELLEALSQNITVPVASIVDVRSISSDTIEEIKTITPAKGDYEAFQIACNYKNLPFVFQNKEVTDKLCAILEKNSFNSESAQTRETILRYKAISEILQDCLKQSKEPPKETFTSKLDKILTHRIWGIAVFRRMLDSDRDVIAHTPWML